MAENTPDLSTLSLEQLVQNINSIAQILSRLTMDIENGTGLLWQPLNSLLTSISALSGTLTTNNLIMGSGLGTVAAKTLSEVIDANFGSTQGTLITRGATLWDDFAVGTSGQFLKTQGAAANIIWADAFVKVALQVFVAGATYTPTTGIMFGLLGAVGGGAGGGGCADSGAGTQGSGGGGGGGSTSLSLKTAAQIGASQSVTIGGTANGGTAGNNAGTAGSDSSIGSLVVGKGGGAGGGAAGGAIGTGGAGGVAGTGDITIPGQSGRSGWNATIVTLGIQSGEGGSSGLGFGGGARSAAAGETTGINGGLYGGGGSGGRTIAASGAAAGGTGAAGIAFALDFCKV